MIAVFKEPDVGVASCQFLPIYSQHQTWGPESRNGIACSISHTGASKDGPLYPCHTVLTR